MMVNSKMMNVNLTRGNVCDVLRAITSVRIDFMNEIRNKNTTAERKKIAESSLEMWNKLYSEIKSQLENFDKESEN